MVCSYTLLATALAALYASPAHGAPQRKAGKSKINDLLGFDPDAVRKSHKDDILPQMATFNITSQPADYENESWPQTEPNILDTQMDEHLSKRYIDGVDNRYQYSDQHFPFSVTGRLAWSSGTICSGAIVGPRHVLTAKHCLPSSPIPGTFTPAYDNGTAPFGSGSVITTISTGPAWGAGCGWKFDWAILILDTRLGDSLGWFGTKVSSKKLLNTHNYFHLGYPGDRDGTQRPYRTDVNDVDGDRGFDCDATGPYFTDTDCYGGQSGGPHWMREGNKRYIYGTLSVTLVDGLGTASGWAGGVEMVRAIAQARKQYP